MVEWLGATDENEKSTHADAGHDALPRRAHARSSCRKRGRVGRLGRTIAADRRLYAS